MPPQRYKDAGVDVDAAARLVGRIGKIVGPTHRPEVLGGLGHFGALWNIPAGRFEDLVLVSGTDGVGTKLMVAQAAGRHRTIGVDLVAMCVNDVLCAGAEPFFFLDYFATGRLDVGVAEDVIAGIADGCAQAGCSLVGGETAEMPGVYEDGVYDLAGFTVGGVERRELLDGSAVADGMALLGLASSGLHSNGYSLVRKIVFEEQGLTVEDAVPGLGGLTVGDMLLEPTRIYVKPVLDVLKHHDVAAACHITGGGFYENLPRLLPEGLAMDVDTAAWELPPVFSWLREVGELGQRDLYGTFNCGIGMVLVVPQAEAAAASKRLGEHGVDSTVIGRVTARHGDSVVLR